MSQYSIAFLVIAGVTCWAAVGLILAGIVAHIEERAVPWALFFYVIVSCLFFAWVFK